MNTDAINELFSSEFLQQIFPPQRSNDFFEALFGDAADGAYDIALTYQGVDQRKKALRFHLDLHERPGCCLACNLTHGLPEVFSRHPIINIKGLVAAIDSRLGDLAACGSWKLGGTVQQSRKLHSIPLEIFLN